MSAPDARGLIAVDKMGEGAFLDPVSYETTFVSSP
jgi:hypothetical protein